jgi:hypothetical protein
LNTAKIKAKEIDILKSQKYENNIVKKKCISDRLIQTMREFQEK